MRSSTPASQAARPADGLNIRAHRAGVLIAFFGGGTDIANAHWRQPGHIVLSAARRIGIAVAEAHTVALIDEIKMRVDLQNVNVP